MTLHQAIANATKAGVKVCHPLIEGSKLLTPDELNCLSIPLVVAISNEWELEARTVKLNEHTAKGTMIKVLRKYIIGEKIDQVADALLAEFFVEYQ